MDEPFGAVDAIVRTSLQDEILRIHGALGTTILFVTHDVDEALRLADRIVVMREGHIEQAGTPLELLSAPATDYVASLLDTHDAVRRLGLMRVADLAARPAGDDAAEASIPAEADAARRARAVARRLRAARRRRRSPSYDRVRRHPARDRGCGTDVNFAMRHPWQLLAYTLQHVELVLVSLAIACAIALPLGVFVARNRRAGAAVLAALNVVYTIPSLALLALLIPLFGTTELTAFVALVAYAQMILVRNVAVGLRGVNPALVDAARGIGMTPSQVFWRVEVPQALPSIVGGLRVATIALIALATLAAYISAGGLGALVLYGLRHDVPDRAIAGSVMAALLAIGADAGLRALERRLTRS